MNFMVNNMDGKKENKELARAITIHAAARLMGEWARAGIMASQNEHTTLKIAKLWAEWVEGE
jgi:hypothetical protein